ncbi:CCA tRNA nucleotidyltransferase [Candidatus Peregrinibacteria bacterium]|nr:CCA tRNA nucleotidyltransferase [Candidatus Peregrinibacteria bacterium]
MKLTSIEIIKILRQAGFIAYWAGGSVRDMLLGIRPKDFDIATSAQPSDLKKLLEKIHPIGEKYGVVIAERKGLHFEVATFRSDSGYSDGRRPDAVLFTNPQEDAKRRDFTINALFYDPLADKIYDFVGGQDDLKNKLIRFIGDPHERILEDHLRIIRAIRFKNTFGFQYHPDTYQALKKHAKLSVKVSAERLQGELHKMILHLSFPQALEDMEDTGVLALVLPEIQALKGVAQPPEYHTEGDVWTHTLRAIAALKPDASFILRWAVFLHDVGKPETFKIAERIRFDHHAERSAEIVEKILRRLKFSVKDMRIIQWLVKHHMMVYNVLDMPIGRRRHWFLNPWYLDLLEVNRCDASGTVPCDLSTYNKVLALYRKDMKEMPREPKRLLTGEEIMALTGLKPGKKIAEILEELRLLQLEKKLTTKAQAKVWLKKIT